MADLVCCKTALFGENHPSIFGEFNDLLLACGDGERARVPDEFHVTQVDGSNAQGPHVGVQNVTAFAEVDGAQLEAVQEVSI